MSTLSLPVHALATAARDDARPESPPGSRTRVLRSADLLAGAPIVRIDHHGEVYTLRETRLGKLILTK